MTVYFHITYPTTSGSGSSVVIVTGYGLDSPGIEFRWGRDFPRLSRPALRPTQPPVFPAGKGGRCLGLTPTPI